jgi:hypothetical protein
LQLGVCLPSYIWLEKQKRCRYIRNQLLGAPSELLHPEGWVFGIYSALSIPRKLSPGAMFAVGIVMIP